MAGQLGFAFAQLIPLAFSALKSGDAKKEAERAAQYEANYQKIAAGQAVMATSVMTDADKAFLRKVWPQIRVAAKFTDPNWSSIGYPNGPALTPAAKAAITYVWPQVRVAANFDDVNWQFHAVPTDLLTGILPLPEVGAQNPLPAYVPPAQTYVPPQTYLPPGTPTPGTVTPQGYTGAPFSVQNPIYPEGYFATPSQQASPFSWLTSDAALTIAAVGIVGALIFTSRR